MKRQLITALVLAGLAGTAFAGGPELTKSGPKTERAARVFAAPRAEATASPTAGKTRLTAPTMSKNAGRQYGNLHSALALPKAGAPVMRVLGDGTTIYGSLIYSDAWGGSAAYGLYTFPATATPTATLVQNFGGYEANGGGAYLDGKYYFNSYVYTDEMGYTFSTFITYDLATGESTKVINSFMTAGFDQTQITHDMAADPTTGTIYAISYIKKTIDEEGMIERYRPAISTMDPTMGWATPIAETPGFIAIACNRAGELYGITKGSESALYRINKTTGDCTEIGPTGLNPEFVQSATFDPVTDKLYWAETQINGTSGLYEVDVHTGRASKIASFAHNEEFTGLFIPEPQIAEGAPAIAGELKAEFTADALTGSLSFTAPTLTQGGAQLSGKITAEVSLDGEEFATRDMAPGEKVALEATVTEGVHNFGVYFHNAAGDGSRTALSFHAGMDAPAAVGALTLKADSEGRPSLSWEAPATGRNDGYIDPAQITYKVVRLPEGLTVADGIKTTAFTDRSEFEAQNVSYTVTPYIGTREGLSATTAEELFGSGSELPVTFGFDSKDAFNLCTVIDANGDRDDRYHWGAWYYGPDFPAAKAASGAVYGFSPEGPADDWLILPPFTAQAGRNYRVTFKWHNSSDAETVAVTAGTDKTVAAQTVTVSAAKSYNNHEGETTSYEFAAPAAGNCFVGFHITSKRKAGYFYVETVTVDEVPVTGAPGAPTDFTVTPGEKGALSATLSLKAPALTAEGSALSAITRIDIYRGNDRTAIHSFPAPAPAATLSWTDTEAAHGVNAYRAVAFNAAGQGEKAVAEAYVGWDIPEAVTDAVLTDEGGVPTVRWTAPTKGVNGGYIDPSQLTYLIRRSDGSLMTNKATGTEFKDTSLNPMEKQYFIYYQIQPVSTAGVGDYALTNHIIYGEPYEGEFRESWADAAAQNDPWVIYKVKGNDQLWTLMSQGQSPVCMPVDGDGGVAVFQSTMGRINDAGRLVSPKLALNSFDVPVLTFYVYNKPSQDAIYGGDPYLDRLIPELQLPDGTFVALDEPIYVDDPEWSEGWLGYEYDLSAYKSYDYVQLSFHGIADYENDICLDAISVTNEAEYDLGIYTFTAPATVKAGKDVRMKVTVANYGINAAEGFRINILRDGKDYTFMTSSKAVPAKSYATYTLNLPTTAEDEGKTYTWQAVIEWDKDKISANNRSESVTTKVLSPDVPEVTNISGAMTDKGVSLNWSGLDALRVNDSFEGFAAFSIDNLGDYSLIDGDGCPTFSFAQIDYDNAGAPMAFMAFNPWILGIPQVLPEWGAHSGQQVLAAFGAANYDGTGAQSDDWLISPEIHGGSTLDFWAKTANPEFGLEKFEVMYSATNTDRASFSTLDGGTITAPGEWTHYEFTLPSDAKYFALHYNTNDGFVLYIDDLGYKARIAAPEFVLSGYRVYRDGVAIADLPASAHSHIDGAAPTDGEHVYGVSALYTNGRESAPAEVTVRTGTSGIDSTEEASASVRAEGRTIVIRAAAGSHASVVNAAGVTIFSGITSGSETRVEADAPGIYVVRIEKASFKLNI